MRDAILDLFGGSRSWGARASAGERIAWLSKRAIPDRPPNAGPWSLLVVAEGAADDLSPEAADLLLLERAEGARPKLDLTIGDPAAGSILSRRFDAVVLAAPFSGDEAWRTVQKAWARLVEGGPLVIVTPFGEGMTPSALVRVLRALVQPAELFVKDGFIHFAGEKREPTLEAWQTLASKDRLVEIAEGAVLEIQRTGQERIQDLQRARRLLISSSARRARSTEQSLRSALEQNARLRQALDRTRRSARYQLGSAFLTAAKPSKEMLRLPAKLLEIYRAKRSGRPVLEDEGTDQAPALKLLDARLEKFLGHVKRSGAKRVVFLFSGTTIGGVRGNRPWALTKVFLEKHIPVYFTYYGTIADQNLPAHDNPNLLEVPVDFALSRIAELVDADTGGAMKIFINAYPLAAVARFLNLLNVKGWITVYDSLDDWEEFANASFANWYSSSAERFIVNNADLTFAVSRPLVEKLQSFTDRTPVLLSPNALDPSFVQPGYTPKRAGRVKVGYFGHLTPAWFDWNATKAIARDRPELTFEIVGYGAPESLDLPPNMRMLGPKTPREINELAAEWHAAIIPFKVGKLADAVDPIKVYEYLALQLPVVSFRMPQIADYPYTRTVETQEDFLAALDAAVSMSVDPEVVRRFLAKNTWTVRAEEILTHADRIAAEQRFEKTLAGGSA